MNKEKRKCISSIRCRKGVSFLGIQETRLASTDLFLLRSLWGIFFVRFCYLQCLVYSFSNFSCYMVNVYLPQEENKKNLSGIFLSHFMGKNKGAFFIFGDFNIVR
uniref:Endonuclease/exonuclease/phosphatase domain-containing protein n=1 Tax=Lactuca sativa TaxID=4236 RepID=A0A9R1XJY5_LACSA|nr:hypothetical protein LSAT_V11C300133870 [Lactuca sativa]